jgi:hypothetical protein
MWLQGILQIDPENRWTPWQALQHPFMTDQPFMGSFTPPPEPREFAPNAHHQSSNHHRTHHHAPTAMHTGIVPVSVQPGFVQVSPYAATHTGSSHMGDNLSQAIMHVDLRSTPRSSSFTGDRSGIPSNVFPMVGPSVVGGLVRFSPLAILEGSGCILLFYSCSVCRLFGTCLG